jgi:putative endonuclease
MSHLVYILYSATLEKYYIGFTSDEMSERLRKHNTNHKGFTGGIGDWAVVYTESFNTAIDARKRELQIKKWKSRIMIERLISRQSSAGSGHPDL